MPCNPHILVTLAVLWCSDYGLNSYMPGRECIGPRYAAMVNPMYAHTSMQPSFQWPSRNIGHATSYFGIVGVGNSKMAGS